MPEQVWLVHLDHGGARVDEIGDLLGEDRRVGTRKLPTVAVAALQDGPAGEAVGSGQNGLHDAVGRGTGHLELSTQHGLAPANGSRHHGLAEVEVRVEVAEEAVDLDALAVPGNVRDR